MKHFSINPDIKRIDMFDERWYKIPINGKDIYLPSVNEILGVINKGVNYDDWLKNNGHNSEIIMDRAGKFGSMIHELIENFLKGVELNYNIVSHLDNSFQIWHRFLIWCTWFKEVKDQIKYSEESIERIVYDIDNKYAGTCDFLCNYNNEYAIFDWKTGNTVGDKEDMQLVAYARALEKQLKISIPKCYIMWIPAKAPNKKGYRIIEIENKDEIFNSFLASRDLWHYKNESKPKFLQFPTEISISTLQDTELITNLGEKNNGTY